MALSLYNTLSAKKEPFAPQEAGKANVYVCGPTVYDFAHVGHARCYVIYDVLVRHLRASGLDVKYVRNITDVDDKIVHRAKESGVLPPDLAGRFTDEFWTDMRSLGNLSPDIEPRVSEHIPEIIALIEGLIAKGAAYAADGDVYFSVKDFPGYGKLSRRPVDALVEGASGRTQDEEARRKRDGADFALWKGASAEAWGWESPWGRGRPGWHIECSAMSMKHLGQTLDLHGGGLDLVFPHHENEIAQSEAANGCVYCRHWMHNGFVEVDKQKMGKSLGNFFTVRDIFGRYEPEAIRFAMLTVHYRSPLNFDWTLDEAGQVTGFPLFEEAERRMEYLYTTRGRLATIEPSRIVDTGDVPEGLAGFEAAFRAALDDDLNMPLAVGHSSELLKQINELVEQSKRKKGTVPRAAVKAAEKGLALLADELGIGGGDGEACLLRIRARRAKARNLTEADVEAKIVARRQARDGRDFAKADAIRDELVALGVELMDSPTGTSWRIG